MRYRHNASPCPWLTEMLDSSKGQEECGCRTRMAQALKMSSTPRGLAPVGWKRLGIESTQGRRLQPAVSYTLHRRHFCAHQVRAPPDVRTEYAEHRARTGTGSPLALILSIDDRWHGGPCERELERQLQDAAWDGDEVTVVRLLQNLGVDPAALHSAALKNAGQRGRGRCVELLLPVSDPKAHNSEPYEWLHDSGMDDACHCLRPCLM